jgi:hypothetical protein
MPNIKKCRIFLKFPNNIIYKHLLPNKLAFSDGQLINNFGSGFEQYS